ncbi:hypothetical protein [Halobacillus naozhouensis]|uniref:CAAX protease self-immunity n=1 Tax=Halobacillus naozhouensis TaxID=554880 RepID=A0ABY8IYQ5_9BACI|nr:hypothetical protein [Halobacillus naozhouensis]WFT74419.1 hypothetical protein P9989_19005 [Halobacillus naozhouensis]
MDNKIDLTGILAAIIMELLGGTYQNSKTESIQTDRNIVRFIVGFISAAIISPIYEEIFYRWVFV